MSILFLSEIFLIYVLFVHKKSVSKRKNGIIFIKNLNFKKTQKNILGVFLSGFFWVGFLDGFFIANPASTAQFSGPVPGCCSPNQQRIVAAAVVGVDSVGRVEEAFAELQRWVLQVHTVPL
jgi:hypothetical protein